MYVHAHAHTHTDYLWVSGGKQVSPCFLIIIIISPTHLFLFKHVFYGNFQKVVSKPPVILVHSCICIQVHPYILEFHGKTVVFVMVIIEAYGSCLLSVITVIVTYKYDQTIHTHTHVWNCVHGNRNKSLCCDVPQMKAKPHYHLIITWLSTSLTPVSTWLPHLSSFPSLHPSPFISFSSCSVDLPCVSALGVFPSNISILLSRGGGFWSGTSSVVFNRKLL